MRRRKDHDLTKLWADMDAAQMAVAGLSGVLKQLLDAGFTQPAAEAIILQATGVSVTYVLQDEDLLEGNDQ
jgi:hypothetical protein